MMTVKIEISKAFNKQAADYELAAKVQQEIGSRLFDRLQYLKMSPRRILDLGCGPGHFSKQLALRYPTAQIVGVDLAHGMLLQSQAKQGWRRKWSLVTADMEQMPFDNGLFDLVFANQVIHWADSLPRVFSELNRIMNVNACLMFTTLGPDSLTEIKKAWFGVNEHAHVNEFADMHDLGDGLMAAHFLEPVMDMEMLTAHYETLPQLIHSLKMQGVKNLNPRRNQGLTGKNTWSQFTQQYDTQRTTQGKYPLTYEVVYGHAWKGAQRKTDKGIETVIPISQITRNKL